MTRRSDDSESKAPSVGAPDAALKAVEAFLRSWFYNNHSASQKEALTELLETYASSRVEAARVEERSKVLAEIAEAREARRDLLK